MQVSFPGSPSAFGSVHADAPGMMREWGFTFQFNAAPSATNADQAICSGSADGTVTQFQPVLPVLAEDDSLNIYGIQAAAGGNGTPLTLALNASGNDEVTRRLWVGTANRNGPWFQHFEHPIKIQGPAKVWMETLDRGSTPYGYNSVTLEVIHYVGSARTS